MHRFGLLICLVGMSLSVEAATVEQFSPHGTVKDVRQVTARFSENAVTLGDPRLPDPFDVDCAAPGHGRWVDSRNWAYDFNEDLAGGLRCKFHLKRDFKLVSGAALTGARDFGFDTGGPAIRAQLPSEGASIDENQTFILGLDAAATPASIAANAYCAVDNLAERLPLKVLEGKERQAVLEQRRTLGYQYFRVLWKDGAEANAQVKFDALAKAEQNLAVVQCPRTLPATTKIRLVWGKGIAAASGLATPQDQALEYKVRPTFTVSFSCERVNEHADCIPVRPMTVEFSAPVAREWASKIRLSGAEGRAATLPDGTEPFVERVSFNGLFPELAKFKVELPAGLVDDAGRKPENVSRFPLEVATDAAPLLAKFNGEFGILEAGEGGVLPVTLRKVEAPLPASKIGGSWHRIDDEGQILAWMGHVKDRMQGEWVDDHYEQPGKRSVFAVGAPSQLDAQPFSLDWQGGEHDAQVVGIPLKDPGFYVVELASPKLGEALLDEKRPRYVATTALVTNLGVHFKWGREGSAIFVATLDTGSPVAGAAVRIGDGCDGHELWTGITDGSGIARVDAYLSAPMSSGYCRTSDRSMHPLMISARKGGDLGFVLSSWNDGIAPYDFNLSTDSWSGPWIAHTVLDRTLFRAGETVSMKHFWRQHQARGITVPPQAPDKLVIAHQGSDDAAGEGGDAPIEIPLSFDAQGIALSQWKIPKEARLGVYTLTLKFGDKIFETADLRVEEFRVPTMRAVVQAPAAPAVAVKELPLDLFVGYMAGGGAPSLPVKLRTQAQTQTISFKHFEGFHFDGKPVNDGIVDLAGGGFYGDDEGEEIESSTVASSSDAAHPAQTLPLTLDAHGVARVTVPDLVVADGVQQLTAELEYPDANGELRTASSKITLWPAALVLGVRTDGWISRADQLKVQAVALDLNGKPLPGQAVKVELYERRVHSYRKRLVGGFYGYSHTQEIVKLTANCSQKTDVNGLVNCELAPGVGGTIIVSAQTADAKGRVARAVIETWTAGKDDWWFAQANSDRMDLIPQQRQVEPGSSAKIQVRMPFRHATALVTVEREGVLDAFVRELDGREPVLDVPIKEGYSPNVYISVLAVRPRVSGFRARWYDFLRWAHLDKILHLQLDGGSATAMVDLSKPAFRLGETALDVGWAPHRLNVDVHADHDSYKIRGTAQVDIKVTPAGGGALPSSAEIAFVAVDEALLELRGNGTWRLLESMMQPRGLEVYTSTAQMQVVGKRHYGRKSLPPGGGGGYAPARELMDTLLLWKARVPLDAQGQAKVSVPLNDALSSFRLVAVANAGTDRFGTGSTTIHTTQDIQLLSGLPPVLRQGDHLEAQVTIRNASQAARAVHFTAQASLDQAVVAAINLAQDVQVPAGGAVQADVTIDAPLEGQKLHWTISATDTAGGAAAELLDRLKVEQDLIPVTPVRVQQATLMQIAAPTDIPVQKPADAEGDRGGIRVALAASLTASLDGVRDWMMLYPYDCFEQLASRAIVLDDRAGWDALMQRLPAYLDRDGLVRYFPIQSLDGSEVLTAYLMSVAAEAGWPIPDTDRARMSQELAAYAQGRIKREWQVRTETRYTQIAAIAALARYGEAKPDWLSNLTIEPNLWATSAVLDWMDILKHMDQLPNRATRMDEAQAILRARLNFQGTTMSFSAEQDNGLWWLMLSADVNANRAVLELLDQSSWKDDLPRMLRGAIGRQQHGHWNLTTANAWGVLALRKFAATFEREVVTGVTQLSLGEQHQTQAWAAKAGVPAPLELGWPTAGIQPLHLVHEGTGAPWATIQVRAAVPLREPFSAGYRISREIVPIEQKVSGRWMRGDTARVKLNIDAQSDMSWVVVDDPVPASATILGGGLGGDSALLSQRGASTGVAELAFEERHFDAYRAFYRFVPKGKFTLEYTIRFNSAGSFSLPATHVEAMYAPEMLGDLPNAKLEVAAP